MAAPGKSSRWGSFLSSAVAGVESRLDTILAEGEGGQQQQPDAATAKAQPSTKPSPSPSPSQPAKPAQSQTLAAPKPSPGAPRSSSSNRANDRLQARLAKAVAAKNAQAAHDGKGSTSARSSVDQPTRSSIDQASAGKASFDGTEGAAKDASETTLPEGTAKPASPETPTTSNHHAEPLEQATSEPATPDASVVISEPPAVDDTQSEAETPPAEAQDTEPPAQELTPAALRQSEITQITQDIDMIKTRQHEEIQEYVERIDSLQAKLQYLSKAAADAAKKSASSAPAGSAERKLAEKDEKIALLLEEGRKLSGSEQKYRTTIRKLRTQLTDYDKQVEELKKGKEKATSDIEALRNRMDNNDEKEKQQEEARKASVLLQKEIDVLKKDNAAKDEALRRLAQEAKTNAEQAEIATTEKLNKALAAERQKQTALEDIVASLRAEKDSLADKARLDTLEWKEKLDRAVERSRAVETELKHELRTMESKIEAMRAVAEEASSGSGGEAQVKLLRQIETLQSQYASASDNWQGIEASLLAKVDNVEKERDEAQRRESEMRKKARDSAKRCRGLEEELQDVGPALTAAKQELESYREQLMSLQTQSKSAETALQEARAELEKQQQRSLPNINNRESNQKFAAEAERRQWVDDVAGAISKGQSRPDSPLLSVHRTFSSDLIGLPVPGRPRRVPTPGSVPDSPGDGMFFGRRLSSQPPMRPSALSTAGSMLPPTPFSPYEAPSESPYAPSPPVPDRDDGPDDGDPSSPRNVAQDMISVSTVGAGPSVQLVERMSAAIRRLEGEKMAAREEMARVCGQRDEARSDMLGLMKDLEAAKTATTKVGVLEKEVDAINSRYQTTLEMLGEKSELVEELRADVQDVKAMYRELVERTVT
ncbi:hypothetical protein G7046_g8381 [Stylonectria norvegica]|nr:hypothetical protein G7046_g8381 [Stylonectria norvegica]